MRGATLLRMSADGRRGHERLHDPCRADRREWAEDAVEAPGLRWVPVSCAIAAILGLALVLLYAV